MALFTVEQRTSLSAPAAWERITDWRAHAPYIPLTKMRLATPPPPGVGTTFVARTGVGRLGFDDPMEVTEWEPPTDTSSGRCHLVKRGSVMTGWAEITVRPTAGGSVLTWTEDIAVWKTPKLFDPVVAASSRLLFGRVGRKLLTP